MIRKIDSRPIRSQNRSKTPSARPAIIPQAAEVIEATKAVGLRYVSDAKPGIARRGSNKRFRYNDYAGKAIKDSETLARIRSLAIPPAWRDVWICPLDNGHLQATGLDARGRKQYRYHPRWRAMRNQAKYGRMVAFGRSLPKIRRRLQHDLSAPGLPRNKVLAAVVRLLETTLIRVGNEEYKRQNHSYGLTTLKNGHAKIRGAKVHFEFRGKSGVPHEIDLEDRRLARIVRSCQDLPGQELFEYVDEQDAIHNIGSSDVNEYLQEITGEDCTAKDFRTWWGTVFAVQALRECHCVKPDDIRPHRNVSKKRNIVQAIERVAARLRNTRAVCKNCYIHPLIFSAYEDGSLAEILERKVVKAARAPKLGLIADERAVLKLLSKRRAPSHF